MVDQSEGISQNAVWSPNMTAFSSGAKATPHGLLSSYIPLIMGAQVQFNQSDPEPPDQKPSFCSFVIHQIVNAPTTESDLLGSWQHDPADQQHGALFLPVNMPCIGPQPV